MTYGISRRGMRRLGMARQKTVAEAGRTTLVASQYA
jgi:hypothetical protein